MVQDSKPNTRKETLSDIARSVPTTRYNARPPYRSHQSRNVGAGLVQRR